MAPADPARAADSPLPKSCDGVTPLIEAYDGFVLDMWGVIHDGEKLYPGVVEAMRAMRAAGKPVVILSNAPRRSARVWEKAAGMGLPEDAFDALMTGGEEAWQSLARRGSPDAPDDFYRALGPCVYYLGAAKDRDMLVGLDLEEVDAPADADMLLNVGPAPLEEGLDDYRDALEAGLEAGVPMICCNPDRIVMVGPRMAICAGTLADHYEGHGGTVRWHGKPYPSVYASCLSLMGDPDPARVLAIGDSLTTDIAGAAGAGLASALIPGGIHAERLGVEAGQLPRAETLAALLTDAPVRPDWVLRALDL